MGNTNEEKPKTLYYYCSLNTFFSIIKNRSIRLTEIGKSNDSLEQKFLPREIISNIKELSELLLDGEIDDYQLENIKQKYLRYIDDVEPIPAWAMCLSEEFDDLSQWRGYGDDANGVCIGFNYKYLDVINELNKFQDNDFMRLRHIEYGEKATSNYFDFLKNKMPHRFVNVKDFEDYLENIIHNLFTRPYYKAGAFYKEKEWRIVYSLNNFDINYSFDFKQLNSNEIFSENFNLLKREYEVRRGYLQSYIELEILNFGKAIDSIVIGPKSKVSCIDVSEFLQHYLKRKEAASLSKKVSLSKASSYR